ncbi:hypothetical protein [Glycomyces xiaoerkulensis]|uniref:hypothetical protein n=1 Tax=Glycomyces xiaoerkulensis TaxID=2038139 RepID=UPI000C26A4E5|nr:hypothetical protein [Glycomyces xiaoerkulensis]
MSDFQAEPGSIRDLGKLLGLQSEHADACRRYIIANTGLQGGEGWLNQLSGAHDVLVDRTQTWFHEFGHYTLDAAESAVTDSADYYARTDEAAAEEFDVQLEGRPPADRLPSTPGYLFDDRARVGAFGETADPTGHLTEPDDYAAQGAWRWEPSLLDAFSAGSVARGTIMRATDFLSMIGLLDRAYDPYEFFLKPVTGDWAGFRGCADVYRNTAQACRNISGNLSHGRLGIPTVWSGNAADSCDSFIAEVCAALAPAAETLEAIADEYVNAAEGAFEFASAVGSILNEMVDSAAKCLLAAGAGASTGPVGWLVGGGIAVIEGRQLVKCIQAAVDVWNTTNAVMSTVRSGLEDFGRVDAAGNLMPQLPEAGAPGSPILQLPD